MLHCTTARAGVQPRNDPSGSTRSTDIRISSPPSRSCQRDQRSPRSPGSPRAPPSARRESVPANRSPARPEFRRRRRRTPRPVSGSPGKPVRRVADDHPQAGHAEPAGVAGDPLGPRRVTLDGDGPAARIGPGPFDGDRSGAGADVPEQLAGNGSQPGECRRPASRLVSCPSCSKASSGSPPTVGSSRWSARASHCTQIRFSRGITVAGKRTAIASSRASSERAEIAQHGHGARTVAGSGQQVGHQGRGRLVRRQHDQPATG